MEMTVLVSKYLHADQAGALLISDPVFFAGSGNFSLDLNSDPDGSQSYPGLVK